MLHRHCNANVHLHLAFTLDLLFSAWCMHTLARLQGVDCSVLSVEYPLAPEHPFPAGVNAAAGALHWLLHESGETAEYFIGEHGQPWRDE